MCQVQNDFSGGGRAEVKGQEAEREGGTSLYFAKSRRQRCHVGKEEPNTEGRVKKKGNTFFKDLFSFLRCNFLQKGIIQLRDKEIAILRESMQHESESDKE